MAAIHEKGDTVLIFKGIKQVGELLKPMWEYRQVDFPNPRRQTELLLDGRNLTVVPRGSIFLKYTPEMDLYGADEAAPLISEKWVGIDVHMKGRGN